MPGIEIEEWLEKTGREKCFSPTRKNQAPVRSNSFLFYNFLLKIFLFNRWTYVCNIVFHIFLLR